MKINLKKFTNSAFKDHRGYYWTNWERKKIKSIKFNHDKFSLSKKNVLRGLHSDKKTWKLVSCVYGKVFFVVVNFNKNSRNYLKYKSWIMSQKNGLQILVPPYYANGYLCLSKECLFHYKLSYLGKYFDVKKQFSIKWNDPKIKVKWPIKKPILSMRDKKTRLL
jgi:dTDP-4-dehydrorhamnose 3,5-epimerase